MNWRRSNSNSFAPASLRSAARSIRPTSSGPGTASSGSCCGSSCSGCLPRSPALRRRNRVRSMMVRGGLLAAQPRAEIRAASMMATPRAAVRRTERTASADIVTHYLPACTFANSSRYFVRTSAVPGRCLTHSSLTVSAILLQFFNVAGSGVVISCLPEFLAI
jgi:hypothetical protein